MIRLIDLHREQNERDGTHYPLPRMFGERGSFDPDIALALAVDRGKELAQGIYFQSVAEMCFAGCDPRATAYARHEINAVRYTLRGMGFKGVRCLVPQIRAAQLEQPLLETGFRRTDPEFASFFFDLEGTPQ